MNWVVFSGRAVDRPVLKQGRVKYFATFTLAVKRPYKSNVKADRGATDFFDCIAFGNNAKNLRRHLPKGGLVLVAGNMETYKTENGKKRYILSVGQVDLIHFRRSDGTDTIRKRLEDVEINDVPAELEGMMDVHRANNRRKKYIDDIPTLNVDNDKLVGENDEDMPVELFMDNIYDLSNEIPYEEEVEMEKKENE